MTKAQLTEDELESILRDTLDDVRLSRSERRALKERVLEADLDEDRRRYFRRRAFEIGREVAREESPDAVFGWLEEVVAALDARPSSSSDAGAVLRAHFSPGEDCLDCITDMLRGARSHLDICVFTITDDRISREILAAAERRVRLRIITDDDKAMDRGSDVYTLRAEGVEVRVDRTPHHMHHKFMIADRRVLLTGSYNWTRSAANYNHENVVALSEPALVAEFSETFDRLWRSLG